MARLSGDEFVILLAETQAIDGIDQRIRKLVADAAGTVPYPLSVSVGVAACEAGEDCLLDELLARADQAMYTDKNGQGAR